MRKGTRWFGLAGLGAAVLLLLGSGLVAVVSDSIESVGNELESNEFIAEPLHDVQAANVATASDCSSATYNDTVVSAAIDVDVDLSSSDDLERRVICVRNNGDETGRLVMTFVGVTESEAGACSTNEAAFDDTCDASDPGELSSVIRLNLVASGGTNCPAFVMEEPEPFSTYVDSPRILSFPFQPGAICPIALVPSVDPNATDAQKAAASTDRINWNIVFSIEEFP